MSSRQSMLILVLVSLLSIAATCQGPGPVELDVDDRDRFTPGGRISYEFLPGIGQRRSGTLVELVTGSSNADEGTPITARSAGIQGTVSIDSAIAGVRGSDHQQIPAGSFAELGFGARITGPARIKVSAKSLRGHIAARGGIRLFDVLSLEGIIGLGVDGTEIRIQGGGFDAQEEDIRVGFLFGGRGTIRPIALFDLYAEYLISLSHVDTETNDLLVAVDLNLTQNLSAFAGYRWWRYEQKNFSTGSDVDLDFRGPTAGVSLKF